MNGMTNAEGGMPKAERLSRLGRGRYTVIVNAPEGCVMSVVMVMEERRVVDALADVECLEETLVALSVASAAVIAEMERRRA